LASDRFYGYLKLQEKNSISLRFLGFKPSLPILNNDKIFSIEREQSTCRELRDAPKVVIFIGRELDQLVKYLKISCFIGSFCKIECLAEVGCCGDRVPMDAHALSADFSRRRGTAISTNCQFIVSLIYCSGQSVQQR
jgi:hypothetical protein